MRREALMVYLLLHCCCCLGFVGRPAPKWMIGRPALQQQRSRPSLESEMDAAVLKIEGWLHQAAKYVSFHKGVAASSAVPEELQPARLTFRASHSQKLTFHRYDRALRYLSLPASNYSVLNSTLIQRVGNGDEGVFKLTLPIGEFASAMTLFSYGSAQSAPLLDQQMLAEMEIRVTSNPREGYISMSSGQVNLSCSNVGERATVPAWMVWGDSGKLQRDGSSSWIMNLDTQSSNRVKSSVQPGLAIRLEWKSPENNRNPLDSLWSWFTGLQETAQNSHNSSSSSSRKSGVDELVVRARVDLCLEANLRAGKAVASTLSLPPVRVLVEQAGSLVISLLLKMAAPKLSELLLRDYQERIL